MTRLRLLSTAVSAVALGLSLHAAALAKADPNKVLHFTFEQADDGFDQQRTSNLYSTWVADAIYETLLTYDYLARPAKLIPETAESLPEVSADGRTYTFHLKKGIYFTPDPAFKGVKRELVAADYAYLIKRILDPKTRSQQAGSWENKIVGLDAVVKDAHKTGRFDYDAPVEGLQTPDKYTLRIQLIEPDSTLNHMLANSHLGAIAREVVEYYGDDLGRHPVGTGAYMLKEYVPRSRVILEANPDYRGFTWDFKPGKDAIDEKIVREMKGKAMPQIGRIEIAIIEEEHSRFLAFDSGQLDLVELSDPASPKVLDKDKLRPDYAARGVSLYRYTPPAITYYYFNMRDPVVGGYSLDKIALRRAIAMSYNVNEEIGQVRYGQAVRALSMVPPGIFGHDPSYRYSIPQDRELANKLLDRFNYKKGADGYRTRPDGKPLTVKIWSVPNTRDKALMEIWKRALDSIGIRGDFPVGSFADNLKAAYRCELMMWGLGGTASIPDGIDFLDAYYGPNAGRGANRACYESKAFDALYEKARVLPEGPERQALYNQMMRQIEADTVMSLNLWRVRNWLIQPWVKGFKKHPIVYGDWRYLDLDKK
ncbi:heme-binding protein [Oxalobacteraceae bacterium OM1]|nr:heme-binding protein [Oxalobacteraceae bacterium OM1]